MLLILFAILTGETAYIKVQHPAHGMLEGNVVICVQ